MQELLLTKDSLLERADSVADVGGLRRGYPVVVVLGVDNRIVFTEFELVRHVCSGYHLHRFYLWCPRKEVPWAAHSSPLGFFYVLFHVLRLFFAGFGVGADRDDWASEDRLGCLRWHSHCNLGIIP